MAQRNKLIKEMTKYTEKSMSIIKNQINNVEKELVIQKLKFIHKFPLLYILKTDIGK